MTMTPSDPFSAPGASGEPSGLFEDARIYLPAVVEGNRRTARFRFWPKLLAVFARVPFVDDLLSVWYCAMDRDTPVKVRAVLLAAIAYFVTPADLMPDFLVALGFTDDAAVLTAAMSIVGGHITDRHRRRARAAIARLRARGRS